MILVFAFIVGYLVINGDMLDRHGVSDIGNVYMTDDDGETHYILSGGRNRTYRVHLPPSYNEDCSISLSPLSISYHGNGENATEQEKISQLSDDSLNKDMIAVYPQGTNDSSDGCCPGKMCPPAKPGGYHWEGAPYSSPSVSDLLFTADLLTQLQQDYCIDPQRIYASGKSNGGGFVDLLACSPLSSLFAAFAPVAGAYYKDTIHNDCISTPGRLRPILEFHGLNDTTIPYGGGVEHCHHTPAIPAWLDRWAVRNCGPDAPSPSVTSFQNGTNDVTFSYISYSCNGTDDIVGHYQLNETKHVWPTTGPRQHSWINATPLILAFFGKHNNTEVDVADSFQGLKAQLDQTEL